MTCALPSAFYLRVWCQCLLSHSRYSKPHLLYPVKACNHYILLSLHILSSRSNRDFSCYSCYWPCQLCRWHSSRLLYRSFHVSGPHQLFPFSYIPHLGPRPVLVPCLLLPDDLLEHCQLRVGTYIALQAFHVEQSSLR